MKKGILFKISVLFWLFIYHNANAQFVHSRSSEYVWPVDREVREKLDHWQDLKFGLLMHWGVYSVPGIVESWSICSERVDWIPRDTSWAYDDYKKWYWSLADEFCPELYDPAQWAKKAKDAGMKYFVFTTKHHDGFAMYDTKFADYSITKRCFKDNPRADVLQYIFDAFRKEDMMIGAYFSKPDWHNKDYWWPYYATNSRHHNYSIDEHPERWNRFKQFSYNQIEEILSHYGSVDILWLDGGWVNTSKTTINLPEIAQMARKKQPGILIVDRMISGEYENYQTPEQQIPKEQLSVPWESCITLGKDWGWNPENEFKSSTEIINKLIEIVAKGGNLLLGYGPDRYGVIPGEVYVTLDEIGRWLKKNGKAIYSTRITPNYNHEKMWFTADKDGETIYALYVHPEGESMPERITWTGNAPKKGSEIILLQNGASVKYYVNNDVVTLILPKGLLVESLAFSLKVD